jgi:hypothetical protein
LESTRIEYVETARVLSYGTRICVKRVSKIETVEQLKLELVLGSIEEFALFGIARDETLNEDVRTFARDRYIKGLDEPNQEIMRKFINRATTD